jgi:hypothetical protein
LGSAKGVGDPARGLTLKYEAFSGTNAEEWDPSLASRIQRGVSDDFFSFHISTGKSRFFDDAGSKYGGGEKKKKRQESTESLLIVIVLICLHVCHACSSGVSLVFGLRLGVKKNARCQLVIVGRLGRT